MGEKIGVDYVYLPYGSDNQITTGINPTMELYGAKSTSGSFIKMFDITNPTNTTYNLTNIENGTSSVYSLMTMGDSTVSNRITLNGSNGQINTNTITGGTANFNYLNTNYIGPQINTITSLSYVNSVSQITTQPVQYVFSCMPIPTNLTNPSATTISLLASTLSFQFTFTLTSVIASNTTTSYKLFYSQSTTQATLTSGYVSNTVLNTQTYTPLSDIPVLSSQSFTLVPTNKDQALGIASLGTSKVVTTNLSPIDSVSGLPNYLLLVLEFGVPSANINYNVTSNSNKSAVSINFNDLSIPTIQLNGQSGNITTKTITGSTASFNYIRSGTAAFEYLTGGTASFQSLTTNTLAGSTASFNYLNAYSLSRTQYNSITGISYMQSVSQTSSQTIQYVFSCVPVPTNLTNPSSTTISLVASPNGFDSAFMLTSILENSEIQYTVFYSQSTIQARLTDGYVSNTVLTTPIYTPLNDLNIDDGDFSLTTDDLNEYLTIANIGEGFDVTTNLSPFDINTGKPNYLLFVIQFYAPSSDINYNLLINDGPTNISININDVYYNTIQLDGESEIITTNNITGGTASFNYLTGSTATFNYITVDTLNYKTLNPPIIVTPFVKSSQQVDITGYTNEQKTINIQSDYVFPSSQQGSVVQLYNTDNQVTPTIEMNGLTGTITANSFAPSATSDLGNPQTIISDIMNITIPHQPASGLINSFSLSTKGTYHITINFTFIPPIVIGTSSWMFYLSPNPIYDGSEGSTGVILTNSNINNLNVDRYSPAENVPYITRTTSKSNTTNLIRNSYDTFHKSPVDFQTLYFYCSKVSADSTGATTYNCTSYYNITTTKIYD